MKQFLIAATLCLLAGLSHAQTWASGLMSEKEGVYVGTVSESGSILARYCYFKDSTCVWVVTTDLTCRTGEDYPALATSTSASHLTLFCAELKPNTKSNRYYIRPHDTIQGLIEAGGDVFGLAMVNEAGGFKVFRFSLQGVKAAIQQADALFRQASRTRDQVL